MDDSVQGFSGLAHKALERIQAKAQKTDSLKLSANSMRLVNSMSLDDIGPVIPLNCLPLEYAFGQNGLPLHRTITIQGPTESSKSSLFWFLSRVVLANGGFGAYFDLETKHDNCLAQSYLGNPMAGQSKPPVGRMAIYQCGGPENFSLLLQDFTYKILKMYTDSGCKRPLIIGVDTLGTTVSAKYGEDQRSKGKTEPEYIYARTILAVQATLAAWTQQYLTQIPVIFILLLQERKKMETQEISATGGKYVGFSKSVGLRMRRVGYRQRLDEAFPVLELAQEKMSQNTKRNVRVSLPTTCRHSEHGFREYSFDWGFSMAQLMADMPATMLGGLFSVKKETEMTCSVSIPAKIKRTSELGVKHKCSKAPASEVGWKMLADQALMAELRHRLNITIHPLHPAPYSVPNILDGRMWLSPDELTEEDVKNKVDVFKMSQEDIDKRHVAFMRAAVEKEMAETNK